MSTKNRCDSADALLKNNIWDIESVIDIIVMCQSRAKSELARYRLATLRHNAERLYDENCADDHQEHLEYGTTVTWDRRNEDFHADI
jgi:hypothetical protein